MQGNRLEERSLLSVTLTFNSFPTNVANTNIRGLTNGPGGNVWFTVDHNPFGPQTNQIGSISNTGQINVITLANPHGGFGDLQGITADSSGDLWFLDAFSGLLDEYNPTTGSFHDLPVPIEGGNTIGGASIVYGPNNAVWFPSGNTKTGMSTIDEVNTQTLAVTSFNVPGIPNYDNATSAYDLAVGPDGNIWFTTGEDAIGELNVRAQEVFLFPTNSTNSYSSTNAITAGPDGNVWFTDTGTDAIGKVNTTQAIGLLGQITEYPIPEQYAYNTDSGNGIDGITTGAGGYLWFTVGTEKGFRIAWLNPSNDSFTFPAQGVDNGVSLSSTLAMIEDADGNLWFPASSSTIVQTVVTGPTITDVATLYKVKGYVGHRKFRRAIKEWAGFQVVFSEALDPASAQDPANYQFFESRPVYPKRLNVNVNVSYNATTNAVSLTFKRKPPFPRGGKLIVVGVTDTSGFLLSGKNVFRIPPNANGITN